MSLIEILVGVFIFAAAMLPLLFLGTSTTQNVYSTSKHLMAGQVAASIMDYLLGLEFEPGQTLIDEYKGKETKVLDEDNPIGKVLAIKESAGTNQKLNADLSREFQNFKFTVKQTPAADTKLEMYAIQVSVTYQNREGDEKSRQSLDLHALKYKDFTANKP